MVSQKEPSPLTHGWRAFLELTGRLDSLTAPQLLAKYEKQNASDVIRKVQIDCHALDYISSAGLRVLLIMKKGCKEGVSLKGIRGVGILTK